MPPSPQASTDLLTPYAVCSAKRWPQGRLPSTNRATLRCRDIIAVVVVTCAADHNRECAGNSVGSALTVPIGDAPHLRVLCAKALQHGHERVQVVQAHDSHVDGVHHVQRVSLKGLRLEQLQALYRELLVAGRAWVGGVEELCGGQS